MSDVWQFVGSAPGSLFLCLMGIVGGGLFSRHLDRSSLQVRPGVGDSTQIVKVEGDRNVVKQVQDNRRYANITTVVRTPDAANSDDDAAFSLVIGVAALVGLSLLVYFYGRVAISVAAATSLAFGSAAHGRGGALPWFAIGVPLTMGVVAWPTVSYRSAALGDDLGLVGADDVPAGWIERSVRLYLNELSADSRVLLGTVVFAVLLALLVEVLLFQRAIRRWWLSRHLRWAEIEDLDAGSTPVTVFACVVGVVLVVTWLGWLPMAFGASFHRTSL